MAKRRVYRESVVQPPDQSIKLIPLTQGKVTVVDASECEFLMQWNWCACWDANANTFYARRGVRINGKCVEISMHRTILPCDSPHIDHKDGNGLNNRRANLRPCSVSNNLSNMHKRSKNASGFKGVTRSRGAWRARINVGGRLKYLGYFHSAEDAARAYNKAASEHFGEFASLNHLPPANI